MVALAFVRVVETIGTTKGEKARPQAYIWPPNGSRAAIGQAQSGKSGKRSNQDQSGSLQSCESGKQISRANRVKNAIWQQTGAPITQSGKISNLAYQAHFKDFPIRPDSQSGNRAKRTIGQIGQGAQSNQSVEPPNLAVGQLL